MMGDYVLFGICRDGIEYMAYFGNSLSPSPNVVVRCSYVYLTVENMFYHSALKFSMASSNLMFSFHSYGILF